MQPTWKIVLANFLTIALMILLFFLASMLFFMTVSLLLATPIYFLWNWLIPSVFHGPALTFWQAWGLNWLLLTIFKTIDFIFPTTPRPSFRPPEADEAPDPNFVELPDDDNRR